jgi:hypothetical protein
MSCVSRGVGMLDRGLYLTNSRERGLKCVWVDAPVHSKQVAEVVG